MTVATAASEARVALERLAARLAEAGREDEAAILEAQAMIAGDPALVDASEDRAAAGVEPALAVRETGDEIALRIEAVGDARVAARGADVRDVADRIARILDGSGSRTPDRPSILVASDVPPSLLAELPSSLVLGLVTEGGSSTSHAAIFARGRALPMVVSATGVVAACAAAGGDAWLWIDGDAGTVEIAASADGLVRPRPDPTSPAAMPASTSGSWVTDGRRAVRA